MNPIFYLILLSGKFGINANSACDDGCNNNSGGINKTMLILLMLLFCSGNNSCKCNEEKDCDCDCGCEKKCRECC